jgi:hypothetical protein
MAAELMTQMTHIIAACLQYQDKIVMNTGN